MSLARFWCTLDPLCSTGFRNAHLPLTCGGRLSHTHAHTHTHTQNIVYDLTKRSISAPNSVSIDHYLSVHFLVHFSISFGTGNMLLRAPQFWDSPNSCVYTLARVCVCVCVCVYVLHCQRMFLATTWHSGRTLAPQLLMILYVYYQTKCGPGSSVGIVTDYGLDGLGSNPGGDEIFCLSRLALGPTQPTI